MGNWDEFYIFGTPHYEKEPEPYSEPSTPHICVSQEEREDVRSEWNNALIIKLRGNSMRHLLIVENWQPNFNVTTTKVTTAVTWPTPRRNSHDSQPTANGRKSCSREERMTKTVRTKKEIPSTQIMYPKD
ncbi:hypothetical protein K2173_002183 [Erythroxylum novogranatense]|uniref:Uncharacterized protein n=1 Tax=Erythroxylum novogranatense TaxID=1862640 RepID=A0AAV8TQN8_9ROSI|nr:hypothetical protein K2173_002183 [Erythroxylum novogranatense]